MLQQIERFKKIIKGSQIFQNSVDSKKGSVSGKYDCAIAEMAEDYIFVYDLRGYVEYVNEFAAKKLMKIKSHIVGKHMRHIFSNDAWRHRAGKIKDVCVLNRPVDFEEHIELSNRKLWLHTQLIPVAGEDGSVKTILEISRDFTERRAAEINLSKINEFNETIVKTLPFGMAIIDEECNLLYVDEKVKNILTDESNENKCFSLHSDGKKQCVSCPNREHVQVGETKKVEVELNSKTFIITHTGMIYQGKKAVMEIFEDITERKEAEAKFTELNKKLKSSNKKFKKMALRDSHTGMYNFHYFREVINKEFQRAARSGQPLSVVMLDIDYYKSINDVYGHVFGDLILKQFARVIKKVVRQYDIAFRYGGDEFSIISPGTKRSDAMRLAQRLIKEVGDRRFGDSKNTVKLKISAGVACYPEDNVVGGFDLVELADKTLKKVKEYGGNDVYSAGSLNEDENKIDKDNSDMQVQFIKEKINRLTKRVNQSLIEEVFSFAESIVRKDKYFSKHIEGVLFWATEIGKEMGLSEQELNRLSQAAILHDLGKIGIDEGVLGRKDEWTKNEHDEFKKHANIGAEIIQPIPFLCNILPIVLHHHERWDGTGYPEALSEEEIPLGARIICIADAYQALMSDRSYRKAYSKEAALEIIQEGSGFKYDPKLVRILLRLHGKGTPRFKFTYK
jgi:diguanylate cyclase (GGDEF)-like protein